MPETTTTITIPATGTTVPATATVTPDPPAEPDGDKPLGPGGESALKAERTARAKLERELAAAKAVIQQAEEQNMSAVEKAQKKAADAEAKAAAAEVRATRAEVIAEKGVPSNLARFVVGGTREEMESAADELLAAIPAAAKPGTPKPDPSQGSRSGQSGLSGADAGRAEAARRFGEKK